uniref:Uncharacterized protein n=1 Tax=Aegilops tauschii subsp. strangulata TaxID=200361 RepID=A0A453JKJ6_AEGTS
MGISSKWIKSLVGIKKHGKAQNGESSREVSQRVFTVFFRASFPPFHYSTSTH